MGDIREVRELQHHSNQSYPSSGTLFGPTCNLCTAPELDLYRASHLTRVKRTGSSSTPSGTLEHSFIETQARSGKATHKEVPIYLQLIVKRQSFQKLHLEQRILMSLHNS